MSDRKKKGSKPHGEYDRALGGLGKVSKAERRAATEAYLAGPRPVIVLLPICTCSQFPRPHEAHVAEKAVFDYHRSLRYVKEKKRVLQRPHPARPRRGNLLPQAAGPRRRS